MKYYRSILYVLIFNLSIPCTGIAEHLVGGVLSYECLGNGSILDTKNYRFRLSLTRDCNQGTSFDSNIDLGIFKLSSNVVSFVKKINVGLMTERSVPLDQKSCAVLLYNVCVSEAIYEITVFDLPILSSSYLITYQRCCRNMTISNITDPGRTGSTIMLELTTEGQKVCNQSVRADQLPPLVVCADQDMNLNLEVQDKEGDRIEYELCAPFTGGGPEGLGGSSGNPTGCNGIRPEPSSCIPSLKEVNFINATVNALNPFPSAIPFSLNNGILSARPNTIGQYVFGVCVKEYRNGVLLTLLRRDIQINIAQCNPLLDAMVRSDLVYADTSVLINCNSAKAFTITNQSKDSLNIKSVYWEFISPGAKILSDTTFHFTALFSEPGLYRGKMYLNRGNQCTDSTPIVVVSNKMVSGQIKASYDSCNNSPVVFSYMGSPVLPTWDYGDGSMGTALSHQYTNPGKYLVKAITPSAIPIGIPNAPAFCTDTAFYTVNIFPAPAVLSLSLKDSIFCYPTSITLSLNEIKDTRYQYQWTLSDGRGFTGNMPSIVLDKAVTFKVNLKLTSPNGCRSEQNFPQNFVSKEKPKAAFELQSDKLNLRNPTISITNRSLNAKTFLWDFGDQKSSTQVNPQNTYERIGQYTISLVVTHENGCMDTTSRVVTIGEIADFYMPNIFSPNGDGVNDVLKPEGIGSFFTFEFSIFDRWGGLVFFSTNPEIGWDGKRMNTSGTICTDGVYAYLIRFVTEEGLKKIVKGSVTLIQ